MSHPTPARPLLDRAAFLRTTAAGLGAAALVGWPASAPAATSSPSMEPLDLRDFVQWILQEYEPSVRLPGGAGRYARGPGQTTLELYGTSDMACILYSLRQLKPTEAERAEWAAAFQSFQRESDGWLVERDPTHTPLHNTAFAVAAMELLGLTPRQPVRITGEFARMAEFLDTIDWRKGVYPGSHKGAGLGSLHALIPELGTPAWFAAYFAYCDKLFDARHGLMGLDKPAIGDFDAIGGTFHYHFIYSHFNRFMPYPEQRIDAVLALQQPDGYWNDINHLWLTLDAVYLMTRTLRQVPHRHAEVRASVIRALQAVARDFYAPAVRARAFSTKMATHSLTAAISLAAEAQQFLGAGAVITEIPLRLVLDRRPFI